MCKFLNWNDKNKIYIKKTHLEEICIDPNISSEQRQVLCGCWLRQLMQKCVKWMKLSCFV